MAVFPTSVAPTSTILAFPFLFCVCWLINELLLLLLSGYMEILALKLIYKYKNYKDYQKTLRKGL